MSSYCSRLISSLSFFIAVCLFFSLNNIQGSETANQLIFGPQWFHLKRAREGGVKQQGNPFGIYASYDRVKRYNIYIGALGSYARGSIKGSIEDIGDLNSKFTDGWIEGRLGYTFQQKSGYLFSFTPFIGVGYATEKNNFGSKSPLPIHFKTSFYYPSIGFRTSASLSPEILVGLNFRARYPYEPKCRVSHDPENESINQRIGEKWQYRVELPLSYAIPCTQPWGISVIPFYEYRLYGAHVNFPFDYFQTKLTLWGVIAGVTLNF